MKIDFPDHVISGWQRTPWWLFWKPGWRRYHWRWTVDWRGCECVYAWQYAPRGFWPGDTITNAVGQTQVSGDGQ